MAAAGRVLRQFEDWLYPTLLTEQISTGSGLMPDVAGIAADYVNSGGSIGAFARNFWLKREVDVGEVRPINHEFYEYWHGPDPIDSNRRVSDTHYWPVWIPENLSLMALERAGLRIDPNDNKPLEQHRHTTIRGRYYAVMRKEVLGRDLSEAEQIRELTSAGYPGLAQAAEVAAVLFAINQYDGSRRFGDDPGKEDRTTFVRCADRVAYEENRHPVVVAELRPFGVSVQNTTATAKLWFLGVAARREF